MEAHFGVDLAAREYKVKGVEYVGAVNGFAFVINAEHIAAEGIGVDGVSEFGGEEKEARSWVIMRHVEILRLM